MSALLTRRLPLPAALSTWDSWAFNLVKYYKGSIFVAATVEGRNCESDNILIGLFLLSTELRVLSLMASQVSIVSFIPPLHPIYGYCHLIYNLRQACTKICA